MNKDLNTTATNISTLFSKKRKSQSSGRSIISGKLDSIVNQKELDLISGSTKPLEAVWISGWVSVDL